MICMPIQRNWLWASVQGGNWSANQASAITVILITVWIRAASLPSLGDWQRAQLLTDFLLLKRAQIRNILYIKWAYKVSGVSHLISKIREVKRPCLDPFPWDHFHLLRKIFVPSAQILHHITLVPAPFTLVYYLVVKHKISKRLFPHFCVSGLSRICTILADRGRK